MLRSLAVLAFIGSVAAGAICLSNRPTVAHGDVIAASLLRTNGKTLRSLDCESEIPIGISGARFSCRAEFKSGSVKRLEFKMDRAGSIRQTGEGAVAPDEPRSASTGSPSEPRINKADPWE